MKKKKYIPPIIFIFIGNFPEYAYESLKINSHNTDNELILLCNLNKIDKSKLSKKIKIYDIKYFSFNLINSNFKKKNKFALYRNGFWLKTIERYFILHKFAKHNNIKKFYHVELDNIISNVSHLHNKLDKFRNKFFLTTYKKYGYGSFIYVNNLDILNKFCNYSLNKLKNKKFNDMQLLGLFAKNYPDKVLCLPTIDNLGNNKKINLLKMLNGLFDEARIGVFLFGHDPRNYCNIVLNQRKYLTDRISFNLLKKIKFEIKNKDFFLYYKNKKINIYNIHIHSKHIKKKYLNLWYQKILNRSNNNKITLIDLNLKNIFKLFFFDFKISRFFTLIRRGL